MSILELKDYTFELYINASNEIASLKANKSHVSKSLLAKYIEPIKEIELEDALHRVNIIVHPLSSIVESMGNDKAYDFAQRLFESKNRYPIIHILTIDIFKENVSLANIPRYYKIIDSSIWNYAVVIGDKNIDSVKADIQTKIAQIKENYVNGLYSLSIAHEYADFNARLTQNSHLLISQSGASHGSHVSPFVFHSEADIATKLSESIQGDVDITNVKWRMLLVDDHSTSSLGAFKSGDNTNISKLQIVIKNLQALPLCRQIEVIWCKIDNNNQDISMAQWYNADSTEYSIGKNYDVAIVCVDSNKVAEDILKTTKFDIILLDYLLGTDSTMRREYSYMLLQRIRQYYDKQNHEDSIQFGPLGRLYFMYISAFGTAVEERLREQGLLRDTEYWHIARGACPTNTPKLFQYYLYNLMAKRYRELMFNSHADATGSTLISFLQMIFNNRDKTKHLSYMYFNTLLSLRAKYDLLRHDVCNDSIDDHLLNPSLCGSLLVYSRFKDISIYNNPFWEHTQHLLYLIAFGTTRQWPEIWKEYTFIKKRIISAEELVLGEDIKSQDRVSFKIEEYIIQLKRS